MTLDEFFQDLTKYTNEASPEWQLRFSMVTNQKEIRCGDNGCQCPISFVATHKDKESYDYLSCEVWLAADAIGLSRENAKGIVDAADSRGIYSAYLRSELLKATQLG